MLELNKFYFKELTSLLFNLFQYALNSIKYYKYIFIILFGDK